MGLLLDVLRTVDFLQSGPPRLAEDFASLGRTEDVPRGHVFWRAGQEAQGVLVPVTGELALCAAHPGGREIFYAFLGTGECAGVPGTLDGCPHASEARATRGGEFFSVDREAFLRFVARRPAVRERAQAAVGRLYRQSLEERGRLVFLPVGARLARLLLERTCVRGTGGARILLHQTQAELATRLGSVREVVAREMVNLVREGTLRGAGHGLFVADEARLRAVAGLDGADAQTDDPARGRESAVRTRRYFLPVLAAGPGSVRNAAAACRSNLSDDGPCMASGCPLALAAPREAAIVGAATHAGASDGTPWDRQQAEADRGGAAHAAAAASVAVEAVAATVVCAAAGTTAVERPAAASVVRRRSGSPARSGTIVRTEERHAAGAREFTRRVEGYRLRVAQIEGKFGGRVPPEVSVFADGVAAGAEPERRDAPQAPHART